MVRGEHLFVVHTFIFDIILTVHNEVKYWLAGPDQISTMPIKLENGLP